MNIEIFNGKYLESLQELLTKSFVDVDTTNSQLDKLIGNDQTFAIVGLQGEKIIANIMITKKFDYVTNHQIFYLDYFCVDVDYRNQGYGTQLFEYVLSLAQTQNIDLIEFTSNNSRKEAHELYKKYGFQIKDTNFYIKVINN